MVDLGARTNEVAVKEREVEVMMRQGSSGSHLVMLKTTYHKQTRIWERIEEGLGKAGKMIWVRHQMVGVEIGVGAIVRQ